MFKRLGSTRDIYDVIKDTVQNDTEKCSIGFHQIIKQHNWFQYW